MKQFLRTYFFAVVFFALMVFRLFLGVGMPLCVHAQASYDDVWALNAADSIESGQWLGSYSDVALVKSVGFPLFLAFTHVDFFGYTLVLTLLWILASVFFVCAVRPLFRGRWVFMLAFALLLFCPVSFATDTFMRVYRNSITAAQVLIVFGGFLGMYVRVKGLRTPDPLRLSGKPLLHSLHSVWLRMLPWGIGAALGLAWFSVTREDSLWVWPFALVAMVVLCVCVVRRRFIEKHLMPDGPYDSTALEHRYPAGFLSRIGTVAALIVAISPLLATGITVGVISSVNQANYGVSTVAEINSGNFSRLVRDLYAIAPDEEQENQRVACSHESLVQACEQSPTLQSISSYLEREFYSWGDRIDGDPGDGQVNGGEFPWVIRRAANDAGWFSSATEADEQFGKAADELEAAFSSGALAQRGTWPSSLMTPWDNRYAGDFCGALAETLWQMASYADVTCDPYPAQGSDEGISYFEQRTDDVAYEQGGPTPICCTVGTGIIWIYRILGPVIAVVGLICFIRLIMRAIQARRQARKAEAGGRDSACFMRWYLGPLVLMLFGIGLSVVCLACGLAYTRVSSFVPISFYYYGSGGYPLVLAFCCLAFAGIGRAGWNYSKDRLEHSDEKDRQREGEAE
ncbi:MAG: hypothetical protein ACOX69_00310 [Coriobacteriales bacterium]|jgi:hypothetical protein